MYEQECLFALFFIKESHLRRRLESVCFYVYCSKGEKVAQRTEEWSLSCFGKMYENCFILCTLHL